MSLRDDLIASLTKVDVRPYKFAGHDVYIKHWDESEKMAWNTMLRDLKDSGDKYGDILGVKAVIHAICDEQGNLLFTPSDEQSLMKAHGLDDAYDAIAKVNFKKSDDAKKNSTPTQT